MRIEHERRPRQHTSYKMHRGKDDAWTLVESMSMGVMYAQVVQDDQGRAIDYLLQGTNPAFERMMGLERAQAVGNTILSILPQISTPLINSEAPSPMVIVESDEGRKIYGTQKCKMHGTNRLAMVFSDITEAIETKQKLENASEQLQHIFDTLPIGVSVIDNEQRVVNFNPALGKILSTTREDLLSGTYINRTYYRENGTLMPSEEFPSIRAVNEGEVIQNAVVGVRADTDEIVWTSISTSPLPQGGAVTVVVDITTIKEKEEDLKNLSIRDGLTGIYNRAFFDAELARYFTGNRNDSPVSLLMLDVDKFKDVNDTYGHPVGDEVLREIARRLQITLRTVDVLARYGGDEFAAILPNVTKEEALDIIKRIDFEMAPYMSIFTGENDSISLSSSISIGLATREVGQNVSPLKMLKTADEDMYKNKAERKKDEAHRVTITPDIYVKNEV